MRNIKDIFISYKSEEFNEALFVKTALEENGISCWMAPMDIPGGSSYASQIPMAIEHCKVFVLILSENVQESKWVPRELDQAINQDKRIMPFMINNCELKNEFRFYLSNVQRYYAYENRENALKMMIYDIKSELSLHETSAEIANEAVDIETQPTPVINNKATPAKPAINKAKTKPAKNKNYKTMPIIFAVLGFVVLVVAGIIIFKSATTVKIAGNNYSTGEKSIRLENIEFTSDDLNSIKKMNKLTSITLENCTFPSQNISVLSKSSLYNLALNNCKLTQDHLVSLDFECMEELNYLSLCENEYITENIFQYLEPVADTLHALSINNTSVKKISKTPLFNNLRSFCANSCKIDNLDGINNFVNLNTLYINNNKITSLEKLSDCENIEIISVNNNELENFKGLERCLELSTVSADHNMLTSLEGLENATILKNVYLSSNKLRDISLLNKSALTLEKLVFNNNKIINLTQIKDCKNLYTLGADNNMISDISALGEFNNLTKISLQSNNIYSIEDIDRNRIVKYLDLSDNDITGAIEFKNLLFDNETYNFLDLSNNKISSLKLASTTQFNSLKLHGNKINNLDFINNTQGRNIIFDYSDKIDFSKSYADKFYNFYIAECPPDKQLSIKNTLGKYKANFITLKEADKITNEENDNLFVIEQE